MCDQNAAVLASTQCVPTNFEEKRGSRRKKLWELDHHYHCSVIGTCLTLAELRQIARKAGISTPAPLHDYELHVIFVNLAREPEPLSRLVQKHLDRKYLCALQQLTKAPSRQEMNAYWKTATATGNVAGTFWALLTHPHAPKELLDQVYGDIHMLSHLAGASIRVDMQELDRLRHRCPQLEKQLATAQSTAQQRLREQQAVSDLLEQRLAQAVNAERKLIAAEARLASLERNPLVTQLMAELGELTGQLDAAQRRATCAESAAAGWKQQAVDSTDHARDLERRLAECREERNTLEATLARWLASTAREDNEAAVEANPPDLVGRCVLYVGGRSSQCVHFRTLVEHLNGCFIHHDGGREQASAQLWDVVQQADAVLCPLDCVSHDAVHRIKRFCRRNAKPLVLLPRASLAAFARGLSTVAAAETLP